MRVLARPLMQRIATREARVGVVGLGYVGLPLGVAFAEAGFTVTGFDVDPARVAQLARGESYLRHLPSEVLARLLAERRLGATTDLSRAAQLDCLLVCVPTPLTRQREPDLSHVVAAAEALGRALRPGQLIVLESTSWPGTTEEVVLPLLEQHSGLRAGADFHLAYSPEREDPGNGRYRTRTIPKVVGGLTPACREAAAALYGQAVERVVTVSSLRVAEMAKLLENVFRSVNIALVNELKMLCDRMGLDVWEVVEAAGSKPFGFMPFQPGPGLGGHCIPVDPYYLTWKAREFEFRTRFIELAGDINAQMPRYVVERTLRALSQRRRSLCGARVLVLGMAYKRDVDDVRESPSLRVVQLLQQEGARVAYHDPYVPRVVPGHDHELRLESVPLTEERLAESDVVLILTDHSCVDYARVVHLAPLVVDTRNATGGLSFGREKVIKA